MYGRDNSGHDDVDISISVPLAISFATGASGPRQDGERGDGNGEADKFARRQRFAEQDDTETGGDNETHLCDWHQDAGGADSERVQ